MQVHTPQQPSARIGRQVLACTLAVLLGLGGNHARGNPLGAQVISGQASMVSAGNQLTITNTPGAIIQWQGFSINAGEVTRFVQQSAQSTVLNRVVGQDPSQILGALQSNGKVFLINPNGIVFGAGARVDVNGLVASSLKLGNADFLAGRNHFDGDANAGAVQNQGAITTPGGGLVYLIAPNVSNSGVITSPGGEVILAAGRSIKLADAADPHLHVVVSAAQDQALNMGSIVAQGGKIGIYGALIQQRGVVNATGAVRGENGRIVFKAGADATLGAGSTTRSGGGDIEVSAGGALSVEGSVSSAGGAIRLNGEKVLVAGAVDAGTGRLTVTRTLNTAANDEIPPVVEIPPPPLPTPPTLDQCVATPSLSGCSSVLPELATCIATPALAGCTVVLPSIGACLASPALAGCGVVLPALSACVANPGLTGCNAVLPSLGACVAAPSTPGCSAVLPSLGSCVASPTVPGCAVVLPTLSVCAASPSLAGCSVVLPSLGACVAAPTLAGCVAVLPTLAACTATPLLGGCSVVLPTLAQCTATPTVAGCAVVLPPVNVCVGNPTAAGCQVVLPPTAGPGNVPVTQSINTTINLINTATSNTPPAFNLSGGTNTLLDTKKDDSKKDDAKKEDAKKEDAKKEDAKTQVASKDDSGAKHEDPAKKLYCN